ncbi:uncharacterized protein YpmS [Pullulanibacillus pueri]|uniref:DUF2140 family protein n=1 Tax=Pullulanibacillus pueri TaxID=1437324 RepID=A0A8J3EP56_9BACL|nr:YpmS family protein [Pullulanibacillus pueri]MBM7683427.1 uncharacterized protein YpmS [Pullulanibacillus pueri]GGH88094.1 hypothetical protein GCM10007096_39630 [Pullulanibacillus pueri]
MGKWKKAFLWLAGINAGILVILIALIIWVIALPENKISSDASKKLTATEPVFTVSSHKAQLTKMINEEIDKHPTGNLSFHVDMTDTVNIIGNLKVLGLKIPFEMDFAPSVVNGDIQLEEKAAKLASFNLPESQVLKFIDAGGNLPDWVDIIPSQKKINVALSQFLIKDRYYFKAKEIDLSKDSILFNIYHVATKQ